MHSIFNVTVIYISALTLVFSQAIRAYAGLIGAEKFMAQQPDDQDRETLFNALDREGAQNLLEKRGVSTGQAQECIDMMTDEEVRMVARKFEGLPAAGDGGNLVAV